MDSGGHRHVHKQRVREQWNEVARRWHDWTPVMRDQYAPATKLMLDMARLRPRDRVLDIAAGDGYQSIAAARRVGRGGYVLAVDLAPEQLKYADLAAREAGIQNVETRVMDGENLELDDASFDAALCHFGLMFFPDPDRGLREMWRVLKHAGRTSFVVFAAGGAPESALAASIVEERLGRHQEPEQPTKPSLGDPGVLKQKLAAAGFAAVEVHEVTCPLRLPSVAEAMRYLREVHPSLDALMTPLAPADRNEVWRQVEIALRRFERDGRFESPNHVLVASGGKPPPRG